MTYAGLFDARNSGRLEAFRVGLGIERSLMAPDGEQLALAC